MGKRQRRRLREAGLHKHADESWQAFFDRFVNRTRAQFREELDALADA